MARRIVRVGCVLMVVVGLSACGDDGGTMGDGGLADGSTDVGLPDEGVPDTSLPDAVADAPPIDGDMGDAMMMDAGPPPACDGVEPTAASNLVDTELTLTGVALVDATQVLLRDVDTAAEVDLGAPTVAADGASATVTIPAGAADPAFYAVVIVLGDGSELTCGEILVVNLPPPVVTDVIPDTAWNGLAGDGILSDRTVSVIGMNFRITPSVVFVFRSDPSRRFNALSVNWVSDTELTAVVPSETLSMPAGVYDVFATNPDGLSGQWQLPDGTPGDFTITGTPPPTILSIDPIRSPAASDVTLTVDGNDFQMDAVVSVVMPDGSLMDLATMNDAGMPANRLTADIPGGTLALGLYPIRVTNPDGQFDIYYAYSATASSSGHLDPFTPAGVDLIQARWRHASEYGFDPFARAYMYVTGGIDASGDVLDTTEIVEVSPLGVLSTPRPAMQWESAAMPRVADTLAIPRSGHSLVRAGRFLYAVGGANMNTHVDPAPDAQLDSIDRAKILDYTEMPQAQLPRAMAGDGLPVGTWYWQVSAVGPWGESLPSREVELLRDGGPVEVCWSAVDGATSYNLYRSVASDGRSGTTRLLVSGLAGPCTTDTGRDEYQPAPGRLRGRTAAGSGLDNGFWVYRVTAVVDDVETLAGYRSFIEVTDPAMAQIELRWDPVVDATYNIYRSEGPVTTPTGDEATYLLASGVTDRTFTDDGGTVDTDTPAPDGITPLPPGSLSVWSTLSTTMTRAREGLDALVITVPSGTMDDPDRTILYAVGGRTTSAGSTVYEKTTEYSAIDTDTGDLGAFTLDPELLNASRGFFVLLTNVGQREGRRPPPPDERPCIDLDGDGHLSIACGGCDCDDTDPTIHCDATDICGDGIDSDCDGVDLSCACPVDADGDGHDIPACGGCDCDDSDPDIHCDATDPCGDGVDQDCDGVDPVCMCPVDMDGDGEDIPGCGGCDCNDADPDIRCGIPEDCTATPELCDDGVDQNCDGMDCNCVILFSAPAPADDSPWSSAVPSWRDWLGIFPWSPPVPEATPLPWLGGGYTGSVATERIFLIAVAGDDQYVDAVAGRNVGLTTFEVTEVSTAADATNGSLLGWSLQTEALPAGRRTLGLDALLYFDYMFVFPAVDTERRSTSAITPQSSTAARFPFDDTASGATVLDRFESTSTSFTLPRAYYSLTRVNGGVFLVGGWDGTGATATIERSIP